MSKNRNPWCPYCRGHHQGTCTKKKEKVLTKQEFEELILNIIGFFGKENIEVVEGKEFLPVGALKALFFIHRISENLLQKALSLGKALF